MTEQTRASFTRRIHLVGRKDKQRPGCLRELAFQVADIASQPSQEKRKVVV